MSLAPTGGHSGDLGTTLDRRPYESPVGFEDDDSRLAAVLVGSAPAGLVLVGSFVVAMAVGLWTWGTWLWLGFLLRLRSSPRSRRPRMCCGRGRFRSIPAGPPCSS